MKGLMKEVMYPCDQIREFVFDYAEGKLDTWVAMRFKLHISICQDCNEYVRLYQSATDMRKFRKVKLPPREFIETTKQFLEKEGIADFSEDVDQKPPQG